MRGLKGTPGHQSDAVTGESGDAMDMDGSASLVAVAWWSSCEVLSSSIHRHLPLAAGGAARPRGAAELSRILLMSQWRSTSGADASSSKSHAEYPPPGVAANDSR